MSTQDIMTRIIDNRFVDFFDLSASSFSVECSRLEYEKRNKKKEAKEAAAYEAFQKLRAENRNESTAVNIDQK